MIPFLLRLCDYWFAKNIFTRFNCVTIWKSIHYTVREIQFEKCWKIIPHSLAPHFYATQIERSRHKSQEDDSKVGHVFLTLCCVQRHYIKIWADIHWIIIWMTNKLRLFNTFTRRKRDVFVHRDVIITSIMGATPVLQEAIFTGRRWFNGYLKWS